MGRTSPNRWKGFVLGVVGGAVGTAVMPRYWSAVTALLGQDPRQETTQGSRPLDSIALFGVHHEPNESSTAAVGRISYTWLAGRPPSDETKTALSWLVDYAYGSLQGGVYGALSGRPSRLDIAEGLGYGTALWLFGDEFAVPMLGLAAGPGRFPLAEHLGARGAHLAYGLATATTTTLLRAAL